MSLRSTLLVIAAVVFAGCTPAGTPGTPSGSAAAASPSPVASATTPSVPASTSGALTDAQVDAFIACAGDKPGSADKINLMKAYKTAPESQKVTSRSIIEAHARSLGCL
jgi:hypothetical protein